MDIWYNHGISKNRRKQYENMRTLRKRNFRWSKCLCGIVISPENPGNLQSFIYAQNVIEPVNIFTMVFVHLAITLHYNFSPSSTLYQNLNVKDAGITKNVIREVDQKRNQTDNRKAWKREYRKAYYEANKEKLQAYNREWMKAHKEQMNIIMQLRTHS